MSVSTNGSSIEEASIAGGIAWIVGLLVTFVLLQLEIIGGAFGPLLGSSFEFVVLLFSSLHLWPVLFDGTLSSGIEWTVLPIVILLITGYASATRTGGGPEDGAMIAVGYLVLSVLSVIYLILALGSAQVDYVQLVAYLVVGGVLFPVVFGGIGGWIAQEL